MSSFNFNAQEVILWTLRTQVKTLTLHLIISVKLIWISLITSEIMFIIHQMIYVITLQAISNFLTSHPICKETVSYFWIRMITTMQLQLMSSVFYSSYSGRVLVSSSLPVINFKTFSSPRYPKITLPTQLLVAVKEDTIVGELHTSSLCFCFGFKANKHLLNIITAIKIGRN